MSGMAKVLAALLVLQAILIGARAARSAAGGSGAAASAEGVAILGGITAGQVARVKVADAQGQSVEIARGGDGFVLASAGDYPAKSDAVTRMLDKVLGLRSVAVAGSAPSTHAGLEVTEGRAQRDVTLIGADGKELARVFFGRSFAGGGFVRRAGSDEVHRTAEAVTWDVSSAPATYIDTQLLQVDTAQVTAVTIARKVGTGAAGATATATIALEKDDKDAWKMKLPIAMDPAKDKVDQLLGSAARVWFTRPVAAKAAPEHGLEPAALTVELKLKDGTTHRLEVGAPVADRSGRYARKAGSPYVVELPEHTAAAFEKDVEFFKPAPPEPAAGAPGAPGAGMPGMPAGARMPPGMPPMPPGTKAPTPPK